MFSLSLRLALKGGREALVRLILTAAAVALGVGILLLVVGDFHAYQAISDRPYWEGTQGAPVSLITSPSNSELWNFSEDYFNGQTIERLDVAALGPGAPIIPGLANMPGPGQYYASPALAALLNTVPADELGDRFVGLEIGLIGNQALPGPDALVIVIGHTPQELADWPNTTQVSSINASPQPSSSANVYRFFFALGAIALLIPILILIETATRLGAARREERYAAMRLIGATPRQVGVIASTDTIVGALLGAILGIGIFFLLRPAVSGINITGDLFFAKDITPTAWGFLATLIVVPIASAAVSILSLRRVQESPLDVKRKVTPPAPKAWGFLPLLLGMLLFVLSVIFNSSYGPALAGIGLIVVIIGLITTGPWLTMQAARLLGKFTRGAVSLLVSRRLADDPQTAFRSVSGLVLAVLVGTAVAVIASTVLAGSSTPQDSALNNVLRVGFTGTSTTSVGLPSSTGAQLISSLRGYPGVKVLPLYADTAFTVQSSTGQSQTQPSGPPPDIINYQDLMEFPVLGTSAPGVNFVVVDSTGLLFNVNPVYLSRNLPLVTKDSPAYVGNTSSLPIAYMLIQVDNSVTMEKVRTLLSRYTTQFGTNLSPQTFGEVGQARISLIDQVEKAVFIGIALIIIVAGCSLAVAVSGSLIERKRPFTLLRLSGTPTSVLYRVVLLESVLPLIAVVFFSGAIGSGLAAAFIKGLAPAGTDLVFPGQAYYLTVGAGFIIAVVVILLSMPLLGRITKPENAKFE